MCEFQAEKVPLAMPICVSNGRTSNGLDKRFGGKMSLVKASLRMILLAMFLGISFAIGIFLAEVAEKLAILAWNWVF